MRLNEKDIKLFEALANSETGIQLADYLERLCNAIGYLPKNTEVAKETINTIKIEILGKIQKKNEKKEGKDSYE